MSNAIGLIKNVFSLCNSNHFCLFLERWHTKHRKAKNQNKESRFEFFCSTIATKETKTFPSYWEVLSGNDTFLRENRAAADDSRLCAQEKSSKLEKLSFSKTELPRSEDVRKRLQCADNRQWWRQQANFPDSTTLFPPFDISRDSSTKIFGKLKFRTQKASRMHKKARSANWKAPCECFMSTRSKWASTNAQAKADDTDTITDLPSRSAHRSLTHSEN